MRLFHVWDFLFFFLAVCLIQADAWEHPEFHAEKQTDPVSDTAEITPAEDEAIEYIIEDYIQRSPLLSGQYISVLSTDGDVILSGTVDTESQMLMAIEFAESVTNVKNIRSHLRVKDRLQPVEDTITTAKIKGLLVRKKLFGETDIASIKTQVETKNGVVYLSGIVDNENEIKDVIDVIKKNIPEVKEAFYRIRKTG